MRAVHYSSRMKLEDKYMYVGRNISPFDPTLAYTRRFVVPPRPSRDREESNKCNTGRAWRTCFFCVLSELEAPFNARISVNRTRQVQSRGDGHECAVHYGIMGYFDPPRITGVDNKGFEKEREREPALVPWVCSSAFGNRGRKRWRRG